MPSMRALLLVCAFGCVAPTTFAAPVYFYGADPLAGPNAARPLSSAAESAFIAAVGSGGTVIAFENVSPQLNPNALTVAPGATLTTTGNTTGLALTAGGITSTNPGNGLGYNTTTGGAQFLRFFPVIGSSTTAVFNFTKGIGAFGAYFTGTESVLYPLSVITLAFNDGVAQSYTVPKNAAGGVFYLGFVDVGASINSVSITLTSTGSTSTPTNQRDAFAIDDVRFASIPEPGTIGLVGIGSLAAAMGVRRRVRKT